MSRFDFVGADRVELVERLLHLYDETRAGEAGRISVLVAPTGWGKTRVVQEFYAALVRRHAEDYWPPTLLEESGLWLRARKRIFPAPFSVAKGTPIPFLWLGIQCDRDEAGQELSALQYAERQFEAHVGALAELISTKGERWKSRAQAVGALAGLFGLPDPVSLAMSWHDVATSGWEMATNEWSAIRQRRAASEARDVDTYGTDRELDRAQELAEGLARVSGRDLPVVVVIDDAHWADPGTVRFLDKLLETPGRVLVLATAWPDRLALQENIEDSFGGRFARWVGSGRAHRHDLVQLSKDAVESLILSRAPRTDAEVVRVLVDRADGNPNHLQGLLSIRVVERSLSEGAYHLGAEDLADLPSGDREIYQRIWQELPEPVRDGLTLSTIQGKHFNPGWIPAAAELLKLTDVERGLGEARSPWGWVRSVDDALDAFVEVGLFETAVEERRMAFLPREIAQARGALISWAIGLRSASAWTTLSKRARQAALEAHVSAAEQGFAPIDDAVLEAAYELSNLFWETRAYRPCIAVLERIAEWTEPMLPDAGRDHVRARHERTIVLAEVGDTSQAIEAGEQLLHDLIGWEGETGPNTLFIRSVLGTHLRQAGRAAEALAHLETALQGYEATIPSGDWRIRGAQRRRANTLVEVGRLGEAIAEYSRIILEIPDPDGSGASELRSVRACLANALAEVGQVDESIEQNRQLMADAERLFGADHPRAFDARDNLGRSLLSAGRFREAMQEFEHILPRLEEALGPEHPDVLSCRSNLAECLRELERFEEALEGHIGVLEDRGRILGSDHHATLRTRNNLAVTLGQAGRHEEGIDELKRLLTDRTRLSGSDHPLTLGVRGNLATALAEADRLDEAVIQMELLLDDRERVLGAEHPLTILARQNLSVTYSWLGRTDDAIAVLERALRDSRQVLGEAHPRTLMLRMNLAVLRYQVGELDRAFADLSELLSEAKAALGPDHPTTVNIRSELGHVSRERTGGGNGA